MKRFLTIILITALALCTLTCKKFVEPDVYTASNLPEVEIVEISDITPYSAKLSCNIIKDGDLTIIDRGVCWSKEHEPDLDGDHVSNSYGTGSYTCDIAELEHATTYYARAYAVNSQGTSYSEEKEFTTLTILSFVTTKQVTEITGISAKCGGIVTDDGGGTVTARGVCWSTSENPTIDDAHTTDGAGVGEFDSALSGLVNNTTYYIRAYATNESGTTYGQVVSFNTISANVTTSDVTEIAAISAQCGGCVNNDGGETITARGVCWNTSQNPTIANAHTIDGAGTGTFTSSLSGLAMGQRYYVRAYATNESGIVYGNELVFDTRTISLTTSSITGITTSTAICGGNITDDWGETITARGVCWSTFSNPTIYNDHTSDGTGTGEFSSSLSGLMSNTTYYVKAYATCESGTVYGDKKTFVTLPSKLFSVSATQKVRFAKGNLQYKASTNTWRFADYQYIYIGESNLNISTTYDGWIDLFGWGTGDNPTNSSISSGDYGVFNDWGSNTITNGGDVTNWRTLTSDEWDYVLFRRQTSSNLRFVKAEVVGENGIIILPDDWNSNIYNLISVNDMSASYSSNIITYSTWRSYFESRGVVFLAAAGRRWGTSVTYLGNVGLYWSSTPSVSGAQCLRFTDQALDVLISNKPYGLSVRLVYDAE